KQYRKIVADTLKHRQLKKQVKELEFELANVEPVILIREVEVLVKDKESVPEVRDSILIDYYPNKDNYLVKYYANLNSNLSKFTWKSMELSILLSERNNGVWQADVKAPEF